MDESEYRVIFFSVAYKLQAEMMEFYCAENGNMIGDRVVFVKGPAEIEWKHHNISA